MAWGSEHMYGERPNSDELPIFNMPINMRGWGALMHDNWSVSEIM